MWQADLYFSLETERENSGNGKFSTFSSCLDSMRSKETVEDLGERMAFAVNSSD